MDSLYLLLPLSVLLVLALIGLFAWALHRGQFDDLEREGWRVLEASEPVVQPPLAAVQGACSPTLDPAQVEPGRPCGE
jgi:cbb3-type cytochrome oxidase maturation protein